MPKVCKDPHLLTQKSECEAVNLEILRLWSSKKPSGQGSYFDSVLLGSLSTLVTLGFVQVPGPPFLSIGKMKQPEMCGTKVSLT